MPKTRTKTRWNETMKERLIQLRKQHVSLKDIGKDLGVTELAAAHMARRLGLGGYHPTHKASPENIAVAKHLRKIGLDYDTIGKRLGVTGVTAMTWAKKEDIEETA